MDNKKKIRRLQRKLDDALVVTEAAFMNEGEEQLIWMKKLKKLQQLALNLTEEIILILQN